MKCHNCGTMNQVNKYTKDQIEAIYDLCEEYKRFAHTTGELHRLEEAKANLLNKNSFPTHVAKSKTLSQRLKESL